MVRIVCRGVLFDLDGVLVDSTPAVARVWSAWARERGMDPEDTVRRAHGRPSIETIRELLPHADAEKENALVERAELDDMDGMVTLPGARELLENLPVASWTVVTSCTRALAIRRLEAAGLPVPRQLVTASDIRRGKPDPEPYLKGAERLDLAPLECIAFEDAPAGIRSARAAGARVIGVRTTASEPELRAAGASFVVDDLSSLAGGPSGDGLLLELRDETAA